jgi:hypothetical protein
MSNLSAGNTLRTRGKSRVASGKVGYISADERIPYSSGGIAGVSTGQLLFVARSKCRVVGITECHSTVGAGSSKVFVRKHVAGQTAAPNAAVSGSNIVDLVTGGIAADSAVNVPQNATVVTTAASVQMNAGDKLVIIPPGTWIGMVDVYVIWTT